MFPFLNLFGGETEGLKDVATIILEHFVKEILYPVGLIMFLSFVIFPIGKFLVAAYFRLTWDKLYALMDFIENLDHYLDDAFFNRLDQIQIFVTIGSTIVLNYFLCCVFVFLAYAIRYKEMQESGCGSGDCTCPPAST